MSEPNVSSSSEQQKTQILRQLVAAMVDTNNPEKERQSAKRSLLRIGNHTVVGILGEVIENSERDAAVVSESTEVLGLLPATPAVRTSLTTLLWHDSFVVRRAAMNALAQLGDDQTAAVLNVIMSESEDPATIFEASDGQLARQTRDTILGRSP